MPLIAQPGTVDSTFGTAGRVMENFSAPYKNVLDVVVQPDHKVIVLAVATYNLVNRVVLIRYNSNGTLDNTFSGDGIADGSLVSPTANLHPSAIRMQPDGRILVCGTTGNSSPNDRGFVIRFNADGSLDNSFAGNGILYIQYPDITMIKNLVVLSNGQIMLLSTIITSGAELILIKINSNGSIDTGFGVNGVAAINASTNSYTDYTRIELQADGKFIVGGNPYESGSNYIINFLLARINGDGTLDTNYGSSGFYTISANLEQSYQFADLVIQPDGKVIASGVGTVYYNPVSTIATRINTNGTKDVSFGTNGTQVLNYLSTGFKSEGQISLQSDGKLLLAGFAINASGNHNMAVTRLTAAGVLDGTFDGDGIALLQVNNYSSYGVATAQEADGKVVLAGFARSNDVFAPTIGRLASTGQTDHTISAGSTAITPVGAGTHYDKGNNIIVQADQKIINVRKRENGYSTDISLTRHLPDGNIDSSFGINGKYNTDLHGLVYYSSAAVLSTGKIMLAGSIVDFIKGSRISLLRFNSNGLPDSTYGTNGNITMSINDNTVSSVSNTAIQADGKVVISTREMVQPLNNSTYILRLNTNGAYDNTFNGTGKLLLPDTANWDKAFVQSDGKILMLYDSYYNSIPPHTDLIRFNTNGTPDNSFNGGKAVNTGTYHSIVAIQPDGKIILADETKIARLNNNGSFDNTFDNDGIAAPGYRFKPFNVPQFIKVQTDGKILLTGFQYNTTGNTQNFDVIRINDDGNLDATFGTYGTTSIAVIPNNKSYSVSMELQIDGKILLNGYTRDNSFYSGDFAMIRLQGGDISPAVTYLFTGSGNWDIPTNWSNNMIPPATLPAGSYILIDPPPGGECVLNTVQHILAGAIFIIKNGKKMSVSGDLIIQ